MHFYASALPLMLWPNGNEEEEIDEHGSILIDFFKREVIVIEKKAMVVMQQNLDKERK